MVKEEREHHLFRILYMILFWIFMRVSFVVTALIALIQWVALWFKEEPIESLAEFSSSLTQFQTQILSYLTFQTEEKVFPFTDWPEPKKPAE